MNNLPTICGFNKASEIGDDNFAPSIFLGGCNLKCPYCMNVRLVKNIGINPISIEDVKNRIMESKAEWINISGGEPTITDIDLLTNLLIELKSWGLKIGMSTNGSNPIVLKEILPLLNYVALDIKCVRANDALQIFSEDYITYVLMSRIHLVETKIRRHDFDFEIRTTLFPPFVDKSVINEIGSILRFDDRWVLQQFRHSQNMMDDKCREINPYTEEEVKELVKIAKEYCEDVRYRYV